MKAWINYWVDVCIALAFVVAGVSGLLLWPMLGLVARYDHLLGIHIFTWSDIHSLSGVVMTVGVAVHLALHWRWLRSMTRRFLSGNKRVVARPQHRVCNKVIGA